MAEAPAYQSGLIAALRGGGNASGVSVPGMTMMPNAPARQGSPMSFGGTSSFGNLMTPPSFAPAQGAAPMQPPPMAGMPQASQPAPQFAPPPMTGNLMPAPQFAPAQDYVAPPPPQPAAPAAPPYYETDDGYRYTLVFDDEGNQVQRPWYGYDVGGGNSD